MQPNDRVLLDPESPVSAHEPPRSEGTVVSTWVVWSTPMVSVRWDNDQSQMECIYKQQDLKMVES